MYVQLDTRTEMAILESPPYYILSPACLQFQYNISSPKVYLQVLVSTPASPQMQQVLQLIYDDQNPASVWSTASVPLPDGLTQLQFVANKVGVTVGDESAMIDDISIMNRLCSVPSK